MVADSICKMMLRELASLRAEIEAFDREEDLWISPPGISNSAGTLTLHLCGNLQHYIGAHLGGTGYVRDREAEFSQRNVPRAKLLEQVQAAIKAVESTLPGFADERLQDEFPEPVLGHGVKTGDFLVHLTSHLAYHLGQVDYHRRLITGKDAPLPRMTVDPLKPAAS